MPNLLLEVKVDLRVKFSAQGCRCHWQLGPGSKLKLLTFFLSGNIAVFCLGSMQAKSGATVTPVLDFECTWFSTDYNLKTCTNDIQFVLVILSNGAKQHII